MGCDGLLRQDEARHTCCFATSGFEQGGRHYLPCGTAYHLGCIKVGEPFRTRLANDKGLSFPSIDIVPNFICEACTVRAVLGRELRNTAEDRALLMLERIRIIDQACAWDPKTLMSYQSHLRRIRRFETKYEVTSLVATPLTRPPTTPAIPLMWTQQQYALETPRKTHATTGERIQYNTSRSLRSAASQYNTWDLQLACPGRAIRDSQRRGHLTERCLPTDELGYSLMSAGMARRMGDSSKPSVALNISQVMKISGYLDQMWEQPLTLERRRDVAAAAVTHIGMFQSWLRSNEFFSLTWDDVSVTPPDRHEEKGLQPGIGVIEMLLLDETKTNRTKVADVIVAYKSLSSGLSLGMWIDRMEALWPEADGSDPFVRGGDGKRFTSSYFRNEYLYPFLHRLKQEGDATLLAFTQEVGNRIEDKYYSMHSYRRGGNSQATKRRRGKKVASSTQVYEHGRWKIKRQAENMPTRYREYTLEDRLCITLLCV